MAVEKGKVLAAIEVKFKGKSLTKNFKDNMATQWAEKIDTDEDIEQFIALREDVILEASAEADRRVSAAKSSWQDESKGEEKQVEKKEETKVIPDDAPDWAKALLQGFQQSKEEIASLKAEKQAETLRERFTKDERVKGVPSFILDKYIPTDEKDFDNNADLLKTEYSKLVDTTKLSALGQDTPSGSTNTKVGSKEATKEQVKKVADMIFQP